MIRRLLFLALLAASLLPMSGPVRAQATADQLNKLSLEALTAPAPRGSGGGYSRPAPRYHPVTRHYTPSRHYAPARGRYVPPRRSTRRYAPPRHNAPPPRHFVAPRRPAPPHRAPTRPPARPVPPRHR